MHGQECAFDALFGGPGDAPLLEEARSCAIAPIDARMQTVATAVDAVQRVADGSVYVVIQVRSEEPRAPAAAVRLHLSVKDNPAVMEIGHEQAERTAVAAVA